MGYYTDYTLTFQAEKMDDTTVKVGVRNALIDISGYTSWHYEHDELKLNEAKWYDHVENMQTLSERFPDLKFEVHCQGEDGDQWMIYALGGKAENCPGRVEFADRTLW